MSDDFLTKRGIDPAIWAARGCRRYEQGDRWVVEEFRPFLPRTRLGTVTKVVNRSAGWFMPKHPPPGFPPIPPQLRPDKEGGVIVDDRTKWHYHGPVTYPKPTFPEEAGKPAGKVLPRSLCLFGVRADAHVSAPPKDGEGNYDRETGLGAHNGIPIYEVHKHAPTAAKYVMLGKSSRIDLHPLALRLLPKAEVVFFVLEGTPKTDSVLSAGACAFGVPSVTCWQSQELITFADRHLQNKVCLIVPDGDWYDNWQVERQALKIRTVLRRRGIEAHVCAPPWDAVPFYKAVDDHLGAQKTLGELMIEGREPRTDRLREAVSKIIPHQRRRRAFDALEDLSLYVDKFGRLKMTFLSLKRLLGYRHSHQFVRLLESLEHTFTVECGSLATVVRHRYYGRFPETVWRETPTISLDEYYRADRSRQKLLASDFWERVAIQGLREDVDELKRWRHDHDAQRDESAA
jgi:hypothetical protein